MKTQKICLVFGTRPEIIKLSPIIKELQKRQIPFFTIHTGQHYSENMDKVFIDGLGLPEIDFNLKVGSGTHAEQTAKILVGIEDILLKEKPTLVIVQGDTNSVLGGVLVAGKLNIDVAHVEAGLRSFDNSMPEEINRRIAGVVSRFHFVPTQDAKNNLIRENYNENSIFVVGNTVVDAVLQNIKIAERKTNIINDFNLQDKDYVLITIHRPENTDFREKMETIVETVLNIAKENIDVVWPIHPRTKKQAEVFGLIDKLNKVNNIKIVEPLDYFSMLILQSKALSLVTDSGGLQEESCILGTPCITVRNNTERPESIEVGANTLVECDKEKILEALNKNRIERNRKWINPYGDGKTSEKIVDIITNY